MNIFVRTLTLLTVFFFVLQLFGPKGTRVHIVKGVLVGVFALLSIIVNTAWIAFTRGLIWDFPFLIHIGFGAAFLFAWYLTALSGRESMQNPKVKRWHRFFAWMQGIYLFLTIVAGIMIPHLRNFISAN